MKNLDVSFMWKEIAINSYFEVPSATTRSQVLIEISKQLDFYDGDSFLTYSLLIDANSSKQTKGIQPSATPIQIQKAIAKAVKIIGGRGRRG